MANVSLQQFNLSYQQLPSDLYNREGMSFFPAYITDTDKRLVNLKRPFDDYRKAMAYSAFAAQNREGLADSVCFAYRRGNELVVINSAQFNAELEQYWDIMTERQVERFFESGMF